MSISESEMQILTQQLHAALEQDNLFMVELILQRIAQDSHGQPFDEQALALTVESYRAMSQFVRNSGYSSNVQSGARIGWISALTWAFKNIEWENGRPKLKDKAA